jgi:hypothetical protein
MQVWVRSAPFTLLRSAAIETLGTWGKDAQELVSELKEGWQL